MSITQLVKSKQIWTKTVKKLKPTEMKEEKNNYRVEVK